ncbi:GNAT family N-acetyltransferase [Agrobacterium tumefaciens]|uniref:GNAT family N-acetyltransferase n=1 Tax=Agrobacterium tumefaciens TaxID=358 RepID=A0A4D7Z430_AGRTU|nr:GNAT family N-acetyltransferase [Agrobacterium tumefaciens]QCL97714.1 GNAT family N-acetyltransferase [Agrobacterium tumefaciens]
MLPADYLSDILPGDKACLWERRLSRGIDRTKLNITLAFADTELAGFACFLFDEETEFGTYLHNLYVDPNHRGKGVACSLLAAGIHGFPAQRRDQPVHLLTLADNHPACRFYERLNGNMLGEKRNVMARYPDVAYVRYQWRSANELAEIARKATGAAGAV